MESDIIQQAQLPSFNNSTPGDTSLSLIQTNTRFISFRTSTGMHFSTIFAGLALSAAGLVNLAAAQQGTIILNRFE